MRVFPCSAALLLTACTTILGVTDVPEPASRDASPADARAPGFSAAPSIVAPAAPVDGETAALKDLGGPTGTPSPSTSLQWRRCNVSGEACEDIAGATAPTYMLAPADRGGTVRLRVTARNDSGETSSFSAPTPVIVSPYNRAIDEFSIRPRAYWPLNETVGSSFANRVAGAPPAILIGGTAGVVGADAPSTGIGLSCASCYLDAPGPGSLATNLTSQFAIEAWVKPSSLTRDSEFVSKHGLSPEQGYALGIRNSRFTAFVNDGASEYRIDGNIIESGKWYHVVANHSGATLTLFVNGTQVATMAAPPPVGSTAALRLGASSSMTPPEKVFEGTIDEVALYPANLPVSIIGDHFNRLKALVGY